MFGNFFSISEICKYAIVYLLWGVGDVTPSHLGKGSFISFSRGGGGRGTKIVAHSEERNMKYKKLYPLSGKKDKIWKEVHFEEGV